VWNVVNAGIGQIDHVQHIDHIKKRSAKVAHFGKN
jgi:hypothetical protein